MTNKSSVLHYQLETCLSSQLHCSVWTAKDGADTVVLKVFTDVRTYQAERDALRLLTGVNGVIAVLKEWTRVQQTPENTVVDVLVLPYYPLGDLFSLISSPSFNHNDEVQVRSLFVQLATAVLQCHSRSVVHLDVKPENVLVSTGQSLVLTDFGHAVTTHTSVIDHITGSNRYSAPEVLREQTYDGKPADVYSLGITLYVMRTKRFPVRDLSSLRVINDSPGLFWGSGERAGLRVSDGLKDLFEGMVRLQAEERMTVDEVLSHPWVSGEER